MIIQSSLTNNSRGYDQNYQHKDKLDVFSSHVAWMQDQYHPYKNPNGMINFGTSVNTVISKTTVKYLPDFIKNQDCPYPDPRGFDEEFNKKVCEGTSFSWDQTFTFNNVQSILSLFCYEYKNVFLMGNFKKINFSIILDHSQCKLTDNLQNADLLIIFSDQKEILQIIQQQKLKSMTKLYVLHSKQQLKSKNLKKQNQAYIFEYAFNKKINLAALVTKQQKIKNIISQQ